MTEDGPPTAPADPLEVTSVPVGSVVVVFTGGEIDVSTALAWDAAVVGQVERRGVSAVVVDLADVTFLGAAAVHVLLDAEERAGRRGVRFGVAAPDGHPVAAVLEMIGLGRLRTHADAADALADPALHRPRD